MLKSNHETISKTNKELENESENDEKFIRNGNEYERSNHLDVEMEFNDTESECESEDEELEQNNSYFGKIKLNALAPWWEPEINSDKDSFIDSDDELLVGADNIDWFSFEVDLFLMEGCPTIFLKIVNSVKS